MSYVCFAITNATHAHVDIKEEMVKSIVSLVGRREFILWSMM